MHNSNKVDAELLKTIDVLAPGALTAKGGEYPLETYDWPAPDVRDSVDKYT